MPEAPEIERLKAENASLLESLREAQELAAIHKVGWDDALKSAAAWQGFHAAEKLISAAAEQRAEAAEKALTELLRLYDWRFELAKREKDPRNFYGEFQEETNRLLRQYGSEKKAAWVAARVALHDEERLATSAATAAPDSLPNSAAQGEEK